MKSLAFVNGMRALYESFMVDPLSIMISAVIIVGLNLHYRKSVRKLVDGLRSDLANFNSWLIYQAGTAGDVQPSSDSIFHRAFFSIYEFTFDEGSTRKFVVRKNPVLTIHESLEKYIARHRSTRGSQLIMGVSLTCTFFLIALAVAELGVSLNGMASGATGISHSGTSLASAVLTIAFKFVISAAGLIMSMWLGGYTQNIIGAFEIEVKSQLDQTRGYFLTRETLDLKTQLRSNQRLEEINSTIRTAANTQIEGLNKVQSAVEGLSDIQVTVQNLGQTVFDGLQRMLDKTIAESMERILSQQRDELAAITSKLAESVSAEIGEKLTAVLAVMHEEFAKMSGKINDKGDSQLGTLVDQLRSTLEQGMGDKARDLNEAIEKMAAVLPSMQTTFDALTKQMADQSANQQQQAGAERGEMMRAFSETVALLGSASSSLSSTVQQVSTNLEHLTSQIADGSRSAVKNVVSTISNDLEGFSGKVSSEMGAVSRALEINSEKMKEVLQATSGTLSESQKTLGQFVVANQSLSSPLQLISETSQRLQIVSATIASTSEALVDSPARMSSSVKEIEASLAIQRQELMKLNAEWELALAKLMAVIQRTATDSESHVGKTLDGITNACSQLNGSLSGSIDELAGAVGELNRKLRAS